MTNEKRADAAGEDSSRAHPIGEHAHLPQFDNIQTTTNASGRFRLAVELAGFGLPIVRLAPGTNRPNMKDWPTRATTEAVVLEELRAECVDANWGVLTGNGLGVLDIDTKSDPYGYGGFSSMIELEELINLDMSDHPIVETSSGQHIYFRYHGVLPSRVPFMAHLDVKADGGHQVAAPGTLRIVDGRETTYRLIRGDLRNIPVAPEPLLSLIRNGRVRSSVLVSNGIQRLSGELPSTQEAIVEGLTSGDRNNTMHALACRWWREFGTAGRFEVYELARKVWDATLDHDSFPWAEVERAVESARRHIENSDERDLKFIKAYWGSRRGH